MKVSDILRVKGNTLYTATPDQPPSDAVSAMSEKDIGSLVVMDHGDLVGMLTFREVIQTVVRNSAHWVRPWCDLPWTMRRSPAAPKPSSTTCAA